MWRRFSNPFRSDEIRGVGQPDVWDLEALVELTVDTAGGEWFDIEQDATVLDPANIPGPILIGSGFYGAFVLDGWHRVAGMLKWAETNGLNVAGAYIAVPVRLLSKAETEAWLKPVGD